MKNNFESIILEKRAESQLKHCWFKYVYQRIDVNFNEQIKRMASEKGM